MKSVKKSIAKTITRLSMLSAKSSCTLIYGEKPLPNALIKMCKKHNSQATKNPSK